MTKINHKFISIPEPTTTVHKWGCPAMSNPEDCTCGGKPSDEYLKQYAPLELIEWRNPKVELPKIDRKYYVIDGGNRILHFVFSWYEGQDISDFSSDEKWCYATKYEPAKAIEDELEPFGSGWVKNNQYKEWIDEKRGLNIIIPLSHYELYDKNGFVTSVRKDHQFGVEIIKLGIEGIDHG